MLTEYIDEAMRRAHYEFMEDDKEFFGNIPPCQGQGVWATGKTLEACREELKEVLEDWILIGIRRNIHIPEINGISLSPKAIENA